MKAALTWSANEVQALATKAARGGGAPAGQAASFGRAAVFHLTAGHPPADLMAALDALPQGPILALPLAMARLLENGDTDVITGRIDSAQPALAQSYVQSQPFDQTATRTQTGVDVTLAIGTPCARPRIRRLTLPKPLAAQMTTLAARTLVPESAASRLAGAGAGLTDND